MNKLEPRTLNHRPEVFVIPHNHVCMWGNCLEKAIPEKTIRVGSVHYHFCRRHGG